MYRKVFLPAVIALLAVSAFFASVTTDPNGKVDLDILALDDVPTGTAPGWCSMTPT